MLGLGCGRNIQTQEAIRRGVIDHLSKRSGLDVNSMQIEVSSVNFRANEADAVISFRPKGAADPGAGMQMMYTLERKGNQWVVKSKAGAGGAAPHGAGMSTPGSEVPAGHPPVAPAPETGKKK
jgi:hypothetical protein